MSVPTLQTSTPTQTPNEIPAAQKTFSEHATNYISRAYTVIRKIESLIPQLLKVVVSVAESIATVGTFAHLASKGWDGSSHSFTKSKRENPFEDWV